MNQALILARKEFQLFFKDKVAVTMAFVVPFLLIYILGNVFAGFGGKNDGPTSGIEIAVLNDSGDPVALTLIAALEAEESLEVHLGKIDEDGTLTPYTADALRQGIVDKKYNFALRIPEDFLKDDEIGLRLEYLFNPVSEVESQIVNGLVQKSVYTKLPFLLAGQIDDRYARMVDQAAYENYANDLAKVISEYTEWNFDEVRSHMTLTSWMSEIEEGLDPEGADSESEGSVDSFLQDLVTIEQDQVFGKEIKNPNLTRMVGGYAVMFLLFAVTGSSTSLFEEKNEGIFDRLLSMPVGKSHILWGKILFNTTLGVIQVITLFIGSSLLFDVDVWSNFPTLVVVSIFTACACTSFGMFLASVSKTPAQAQGFGTLLILTMSSLGGAWWPISIMPEFMQTVSKFTLVHWSVQGFLAALWQGASLSEFLPVLGMISLFAVVLISLSIWRFNKGELFK